MQSDSLMWHRLLNCCPAQICDFYARLDVSVPNKREYPANRCVSRSPVSIAERQGNSDLAVRDLKFEGQESFEQR
jgi:hypothetical protein